MELQTLRNILGSPFCKKYPHSKQEWATAIEHRRYPIDRILGYSTFPKLRNFLFLSEDSAGDHALADFPSLNLNDCPLLDARGIYRAQILGMWQMRPDYRVWERKNQNAVIWGYTRQKEWVLARVLWKIHNGCEEATHPASWHQHPLSAIVTKHESLQDILKADISPNGIWDEFGKVILSWSERQLDRAEEANEFATLVRDQELILATLK